MKINLQWLHEWVNPPVDTKTLAAQLTLAGIEIETLAPVAGVFHNIVVGLVLSVVQHPNADRLRICQVDVGDSQPLQIVCGAANVRAGMRAPCARLGAVLPDGMTIKRSKLRGVESFGMLCSGSELGLASSSEGLLELSNDAPIGADLRTFLNLDDVILEVNITPNRGDCLSVAGIARELGVINRLAVQTPVINAIHAVCSDIFPVEVNAPSDCPRYVGRVIRNIARTSSTPHWLRERLQRAGMRSINPVVDVTNYVMLELGQPMHAFDLAKLHGGIIVRRAFPQESITLLDGNNLTLNQDTLVIADQNAVLAIAGIMGGIHSGINAATTDLFFESAFFTPAAIIGRSRQYGIQTDSAYRFERGVSPSLQRTAIERATQLLIEIVGGEPGPVTEIVDYNYLPHPTPIILRRDRIKRLLGIEIAKKDVEDILNRLNMTVKAREDGWYVTPPDFRFDITIEADLIEELARIHGYEYIPHTRPLIAATIKPLSENIVNPINAARFLTARDYHEVITYSFVDATLQSLLDPQNTPLSLANPISADHAVMRTNLWVGLIQAAIHNLHRQQERIRLFEIGHNFIPNENGVDQSLQIAGLATGTVYPEQWGETKRNIDFFDVKADIDALINDQLGENINLRYMPCLHPALHSGKSAALMRNDHLVGWLGVLHPELENRLAIGNAPIIMFTIDLNALQNGNLPKFYNLSKFPLIRRDIAFLVDADIAIDALTRSITATAGSLLQKLIIFDVYTGKGIATGKKSIALGLILQDATRTLKDFEIEDIINSVVQQLATEFSATLRT